MNSKKTDRQKAVKKLDDAFSLYIRARDERCVTCGSFDRPTCGHVFTSMAFSTRWDEENAYKQCWPCNFKHEFDPYPLTEFTRKHLGQEKYDALHLRYQTTKKYKTFELDELRQYYIDKRKQLQ